MQLRWLPILVAAFVVAAFGPACETRALHGEDGSSPVGDRPDGSSVAADVGRDGPYGYVYADPVGHGRIFAVPAGGGAPVVLASGDETETVGAALAFDDANVYFVDERTSADADAGPARSLIALPLYAGSAGARQTLVDGLDSTTLMAIDAAYVYFVSWQVNPEGAGGYIARVAKTGGPLRYVADLVDEQQPQGLTVDGGYVYWTQLDGGIRRTSIDGGAAEDLMLGEQDPREIAVSGTSVYWLLAGHAGADCVATDGAVRRVIPGTFQVSTLAEGLAGARSLVGGGGAVYWSTEGSFCNTAGQGKGSVFSMRPADDAPRALDTGLTEPSNLFLGSGALYFTNVVDPSSDALLPVVVTP